MKKLLKEIMSESINSGLLQNLGSVGKAVGLVTGETQKEGGGKGQGSGGQGGGCRTDSGYLSPQADIPQAQASKRVGTLICRI